jgi:hypothetical protein|mmetsp:Transcript_15348/g.16635  ORF Transcript_15348/g.16635 Transcript_15348/m.16635 type:complete len:259 (+) Transcript_15348:18-794(+)|eukprot:gene896-951_t
MSYKLSRFSMRMLGIGLRSKEQEICDKLKAEVEGYLTTTQSDKGLIKLLMISFNDTARLGMDESIPLLKEFFSFIRHRLIEGKPQEFKRLVILLDNFIRNCGFRAQLLIGRQKFLNSLSEVARRYKATNNAICQEGSLLAFDCIQAWSEAFSGYKTYFPYYEETYLHLKTTYHIQFPRPENDPTRAPIPIDVFLIAEKFQTPVKYSDESDGTASDSSGEHSSIDQCTLASTNISNQTVCYMKGRHSDSFWGSPSEVKA